MLLASHVMVLSFLIPLGERYESLLTLTMSLFGPSTTVEDTSFIIVVDNRQARLSASAVDHCWMRMLLYWLEDDAARSISLC